MGERTERLGGGGAGNREEKNMIRLEEMIGMIGRKRRKGEGE